MALILKDRVKETSSSSGTGNITLGGAFPGYQTFNAVIASGSTVYYTIHNLVAGFDNEFEVGVGTFTSPATLVRNTVLSSSNSGSSVNFTAGASGLEVFITQPAEEAIYLNQATGRVEAGGNGANSISFTTVVANTATITAGTVSSTPINATDLVNKTYVDALVASGIHFHQPVRVESPINLNATYNQPGGAGVGVGATLTNAGAQAALVIDGVTLSVADRVLVYEQTTQTQNGVYVVTSVGSGATNWVLTRSSDTDTYGFDSPEALSEGSTFFVQQGTTGAGETYTCNTVGVITFGTTNITFTQISSAQIYSAGTGLTLSSTTFSLTNTAVTAATYGNAGEVSQIAVNAQGQITSASNVSINASSISLGTLDNARTTAASANGASTIVLRDSNGSFAGNVITATTSNATTFNGTTGAFTNVSGNGVALTAINASNVTSGTLDNARTTGATANSASTLVLRDADGSFGANIITATFSGNAATLSAINASNISSGTIDNSRTTAATANGASTIVQRDSGGNFAAATITAAVIGDLSGGSNINASNIASGTIANARTTGSTANGASTIVLRGASGEFAAGAITGSSFSGDGSAITAINAASISTGTIATARLGSGTANASTFLRGDSTFATVTSPNDGTLTMNTSGTGISGSATFTANQVGASTFTVASNATSANGASTIVARDSSGNFSVNTITAVTSFSGPGTGLTGTAASLTAGTATSANALNSGNSYSVTNLTASGTVTGATVTANSDERLKDNWTDVAPDFLSKLAEVKHGVFTRKSSGNREPGVSAQSLQAVMLEAVIEDADGFLSVNYGGAALVAAIELAKVVEELRAEIAELKAK